MQLRNSSDKGAVITVDNPPLGQNIATVVGTYLVVMLQELEDVKNRLLVQVVVSVVMEQFLKMECAPMQAIVQV